MRGKPAPYFQISYFALISSRPAATAGAMPGANGIRGIIRETLGCGTFCGLPVPWFHENPIGILTMAPGGFFVFGCMIALINKISKGKAIKKKEFGCAGCPGCGKGA